MKNTLRIYLLIAVVTVLVGIIYLINSKSVKRGEPSEAVLITPRVSTELNETKSGVASDQYLSVKEKSKRYELAKEITSPDGFINTDGKPITINSLIGKKVILIDFWTYSCINCLRTTPYLNSWYEKYKDKGFVIIGVHTPEFEFEKKYDNVKAAVEKNGIKFPVVLDNDYSTWTAYKNQYWPRKYLIDIDGYIIYDHIGEGRYEETEQKIQEALRERMTVLGEQETFAQSLTKEAPAQTGLISPETYFGALRNQSFGNGISNAAGDQKNLIIPNKIDPNILYLSGDWNISGEFAQNNSLGAGIEYKYTAKDVFLVAQSDDEIILEVSLDGKPIESGIGEDIIKTADGKTVIKIKEARLYKIIKGDRSGIHTLKFVIPKSGLKVFTFTFG